MPSRRLDDRIRELCVGIVNASAGDKSQLLEELRSAIGEKTARLRKLAVKKLLGREGDWERRSDGQKANSRK